MGWFRHGWLNVVLGVCLLAAPATSDDRGDAKQADRQHGGTGDVAKFDADDKARVAGLIAQLGDEDFARREAAQRALVAEGERLVPLIDALPPVDDAEVGLRLKRIRYELAGYKDDIDTLLGGMEPVQYTGRPLPSPLLSLMERRPRRAAEYLLSIIEQPDHKLYDRATNAFVKTWSNHAAEQVERYVRANLRLEARLRSAYPQGIPAKIGAQYMFVPDGVGWPNSNQLKTDLKTRTVHYLDGKPYGQPYESSGSAATTGWIRTGDLAPGRHEFHFIVNVTVTHGGKRIEAAMKSRRFGFDIVAADTPDHLAAPDDSAVAKQVRAALIIKDDRPDDGPQHDFSGPPRIPKTTWHPQVTWGTDAERQGGLYVPTISLKEPLPVDLCFDVKLLDLATGKQFACEPLVILKGSTRRYHPCPYNTLQRFVNRRYGFVEVKLLLTPSRAHALTNPDVQQYFQGSITSDALRARIWSAEELRKLKAGGALVP